MSFYVILIGKIKKKLLLELHSIGSEMVVENAGDNSSTLNDIHQQSQY